jgi:hypothetical protein
LEQALRIYLCSFDYWPKFSMYEGWVFAIMELMIIVNRRSMLGL